jgi:hypothetical protein
MRKSCECRIAILFPEKHNYKLYNREAKVYSENSRFRKQDQSYKKSRYSENKVAISALITIADRQYQLFQPFHLRHVLPGLNFAAFLYSAQKAASLIRAFLLNAFFILLHLLSDTDLDRGFSVNGDALMQAPFAASS